MKQKKEEQRILNCVPSHQTLNDWKLSHAIEANVLMAAPIPASKDLREAWWRIGDQGQTGSCVGWACADGILRWHYTKTERISKAQSLSVRFPWMASKETDEFNDKATTFIESAGTSLKAALDVSKNYGAILESILPFNGILSPLSEEAFYATAANLKISSYFNLAENGSKLDNFKNWIANNGPVMFRLNVDSSWMNIGSDGNLKEYKSDEVYGGHAVVIVGYTKDYFIVRNSWGNLWGAKGFALASNSYTIEAFTEGYGIVV